MRVQTMNGDIDDDSLQNVKPLKVLAPHREFLRLADITKARKGDLIRSHRDGEGRDCPDVVAAKASA